MITEQSVLKSKEGRFVTVLRINSTVKLCAVERQNEGHKAPLVHIKRRVSNQKNQMAFCFQCENGYYVAKVTARAGLEVEKANISLSDLSDCHWFVKENVGGGEHYVLQSVAQPGRYLSKTKEHKHYIFTLSAEGTQVTDKMIQKEESTSNPASSSTT